MRLTALAFISWGVYSCSLGPYQSLVAIHEFGFSDAGFALLFVASGLLSLAASVGVGILTDITGRRRSAARLAALAALIGALTVALFPDWRAFALSQLLFLPIARSMMGQLFTLGRLAGSHLPALARDAALTALRALFAIPFIVVLPIWALVFRAGLADLLAIFWVMAAASLVILAIFVLGWPRDGSTRWQDPRSGQSFRQSLAELSAPRVMSRVVLLGVLHGGVTTYMLTAGLILVEVPGRGTDDVALFTAVVAGLEIPVMLAAFRPLARWGKTGTILRASCILAGFLMVLPLAAPGPLVWATAVPAAIGNGLLLTVPALYLQDMMSDRPGAGGALVAFSALVGQFFASAVFALGTAIGGYGTVTVICALMLLGATAMLARADRRISAS